MRDDLLSLFPLLFQAVPFDLHKRNLAGSCTEQFATLGEHPNIFPVFQPVLSSACSGLLFFSVPTSSLLCPLQVRV